MMYVMSVKSNQTWYSKFIPFGLGHVKPHHFREMAEIFWENRDNLPYAWRILKHGVCDGCSLGPYGFRDNVISGIHLCMTRLKLLRFNTIGAIDPSYFEEIQRLQAMSIEQLQSLGRLAFPMVHRKGEKGFTRVTWENATRIIADRLKSLDPKRFGMFVTSRGLTNETYYVAQKFVRYLGSNNVDLCSRLCHAASVSGLKQVIGYGAPTCSLSDFIGTDLLIFFGTDIAYNQPVTTKYMYYAKQRGTKIIVVNPMKEHGLQRYWVPSVTRSAIFGTSLMDDFFQVNVGGDLAFMNGVLKHLIEMNRIDRAFVDAHTRGFEDLKQSLETQPWELLERISGLTREDMRRFAVQYGQARTAVLVYSMGLTQHEFGVQNVKTIANLALSRGMIGREKCGIMPIRGHSSVQGGGEIGCEADRLPGSLDLNEENAKRFSNLWGFTVPPQPGLRTTEMMEAAHEGHIDVLYSIGGNLLETMPDRGFVKKALEKVPLRIHQDIILNTSSVLDTADTTILLPAQTRYEQKSGGTSTSTERRIRFTPEIPGRRIGEARAEWEIPLLIARSLRPEAERFFFYRNTQDIREEMDRVMPMYQGIKTLQKEKDWIQWGGAQLGLGGHFPKMPDGRALFTPLVPPAVPIRKEGEFVLTTRRGKQFNSMIFSKRDRLMGTDRRDAVFMAPEDSSRFQIREGESVTLVSKVGTFSGIVHLAPVKPGSLQAYWPEANVLIPRKYDPVSGEPDYNAIVTIEKRQ